MYIVEKYGMIVTISLTGDTDMKTNVIFLLLMFTAFSTAARENLDARSNDSQQYSECVAVSLFTKQGNEINAIAKDSRTLENTNRIPAGWSVIGVTTKQEAGAISPYIVICH